MQPAGFYPIRLLQLSSVRKQWHWKNPQIYTHRAWWWNERCMHFVWWREAEEELGVTRSRSAAQMWKNSSAHFWREGSIWKVKWTAAAARSRGFARRCVKELISSHSILYYVVITTNICCDVKLVLQKYISDAQFTPRLNIRLWFNIPPWHCPRQLRGPQICPIFPPHPNYTALPSKRTKLFLLPPHCKPVWFLCWFLWVWRHLCSLCGHSFKWAALDSAVLSYFCFISGRPLEKQQTKRLFSRSGKKYL